MSPQFSYSKSMIVLEMRKSWPALKATEKRSRAADDVVTFCKRLRKTVESESDEAQPGCSYESHPCYGEAEAPAVDQNTIKKTTINSF